MKPTFSKLTLAAGLFVAGTLPIHAQVVAELKINTAIELEFQTEVGKTYTLQGSLNLTNWTDLGQPVFGNGRVVDQVYSIKNGVLAKCAAYRLRVDDGPTNGFAPWSLTGLRMQMQDSSASNVVEYSSDTGGAEIYGSAVAPFTYQYSRLSDNDAQVQRSFTPDQQEVLTYSFTDSNAGTWVREDYSQGLLQRRELGVFHYLSAATNNVPGATNSPPVITGILPPAPPLTLTGVVYYVQSGALPDQLSFQTTNGGVYSAAILGRHSESGGSIYSYTYQVQTSNTASLVITFGYYGVGGDRHEYDLTFTDGPSGLFTRRIYRLGALYTTDHGAFSPYAPSANPTNPSTTPPATNNPPPNNPAGLTYTMLNGQVPQRLVFQSAAGGVEYDDSGPSDFSYTYQSTGANTFGLVVRFKPDRWDEYDLTFVNGAQGTFVRREFKNSILNRTDSGPFTVTPTGQ